MIKKKSINCLDIHVCIILASFRKNSAGNLSFKLLVPKPYKSRYSDPELQLFLNPYCNYRLLVEWSLIMSLGQVSHISFYKYWSVKLSNCIFWSNLHLSLIVWGSMESESCFEPSKSYVIFILLKKFIIPYKSFEKLGRSAALL